MFQNENVRALEYVEGKGKKERNVHFLIPKCKFSVHLLARVVHLLFIPTISAHLPGLSLRF